MEKTVLNILKYSASSDDKILEQINLLIHDLDELLNHEGFKY